MARELKRERSATVRDAGISTIEVVILTPLIIFMVLIIVAFGILEDANGAVDDAASDAARAGSLERSQTDALAAAQAAATADLAGTCADTPTVEVASGNDFTAGGIFAITISCQAKAFGVLGVSATNTIHAQAAAPLDPYRRTDS